jgi:hypothetical protein
MRYPRTWLEGNGAVQNAEIKYIAHTRDRSVLISLPLLESSVRWEMTPFDDRGCGSGTTQESGDSVMAQTRSETAWQVLLSCPGVWCSRKYMRLLRLTKRVFEYLTHLSGFWLAHSDESLTISL